MVPGRVSIIIPTRNAALFLKDTLSSVRSQTYPDIEVIVADNASIDDTCTIARAFECRIIESGTERSNQLNDAIRAATGEYLYRIDGDFVLDPGLVDECVRLCNDGADAVAVHNDSAPHYGFWSRVRHLERLTYRNDDLIVAARFFHRSSLERVGGFDEQLVAGEDYDVHNRLLAQGAAIARSQRAEMHLGEPRTLGEIWSKSFYYGRTILRYVRRHPARATHQFIPLRSSFVRHWRDFVRHPILACGLAVVFATKYCAAALGALTEFASCFLAMLATRRGT